MAVLKKETGRVEAPPLPPRSWRKLNSEALVAYVEAHPDGMLEEYAEHFQTSPSGIWRALKRLKFTRKKRQLFTKNGTKICQAPESRSKRNLVVRNKELASALSNSAVVSELRGFDFEANKRRWRTG